MSGGHYRQEDEMATIDIRPGRYRHFKGKEYEVLYVATPIGLL